MLSDTAARNAKVRTKPYKLADRDGLYLAVGVTGVKSWRYDYRLNTRRETLTIGRYPDVSLEAARRRLAAARSLVADGKSPAAEKANKKALARFAGTNTFKATAEDWLREKGPTRSPGWRVSVRGWLDNHIYKEVGNKPIDNVNGDDVLRIMYKLRDAGFARTGEACRNCMVQVFRYAIANRRSKHNPAREVQGALILPPIKSHRGLTAAEIPVYVQRAEVYEGYPTTKIALQLLLLTFVRKNELMRASWPEVDFDNKLWTIPSHRMKGKRDHLVPLSRKAVALFKEAKALAGGSPFVIPHFGDLRRPASGETINYAFIKMGFEVGDFAPHGLRTTASTHLHELGHRPDIVEMQLAHQQRNRVALTYNKAQYLPERHKLMQAWEDYIDGLVADADKRVVPIRFASEVKKRKGS